MMVVVGVRVVVTVVAEAVMAQSVVVLPIRPHDGDWGRTVRVGSCV